MKPLISIIVPIYQSENTLKRCVESILNQSYSNIELILVNDGSTDGSALICEEYASKDARITVVHKENGGVSTARNIGMDKAKGDFIQFVDSDDWLDINACNIMLQSIIKNKADLVICGLNITESGKLIRTPHLTRKLVQPSKSFNDFKYIYPVFASPCNKLYKRQHIGRFDSSVYAGEDFIFNLQYIKNTDSVIAIEDCLYNVSLDNKESLNRKFNEEQLELLLKLEDHKREFCINQYGEAFDESFIHNSIIISTHGYLRKIVKLKPRGYALSLISKYSNYHIIKEASKKSKLNKYDKRIFNQMVKFGFVNAIYLFLFLKTRIK